MNDDYKNNSQKNMEGYDDLPFQVRRAISEALHNVTDTAIALRLYRMGRYSADEIIHFVRIAEKNILEESVAQKIMPDHRGSDLKVRRIRPPREISPRKRR